MDREILASALVALEEGESLETVLVRYPDQGAEFRAMLELVQQLRTTPAPPLPERWREAENSFLRAAAERRAAKKQRPQWFSFLTIFSTKPLATVVAVLVLLISLGTGTMVASANALPGSPLYTIKRAAERVEYSLSSAQEQPAVLLRQTEERHHEIEALLERSEIIPASLVADLEHQARTTEELLSTQQNVSIENWQKLQALIERSLRTIDRVPAKDSTSQASLDQARRALGEVGERAQAVLENKRRPATAPSPVSAPTVPAMTKPTPSHRYPTGREEPPTHSNDRPNPGAQGEHDPPAQNSDKQQATPPNKAVKQPGQQPSRRPGASSTAPAQETRPAVQPPEKQNGQPTPKKTEPKPPKAPPQPKPPKAPPQPEPPKAPPQPKPPKAPPPGKGKP